MPSTTEDTKTTKKISDMEPDERVLEDEKKLDDELGYDTGSK